LPRDFAGWDHGHASWLAVGLVPVSIAGAVPDRARGSTVLLARAITLASRPGGLSPTEPIDGSRVKQAGQQYGVEFIGGPTATTVAKRCTPYG